VLRNTGKSVTSAAIFVLVGTQCPTVEHSKGNAQMQQSTLGDSAFPVAASRTWNSLLASVRDIQSLPAFRQKMKLTLFSDSFAS